MRLQAHVHDVVVHCPSCEEGYHSGYPCFEGAGARGSYTILRVLQQGLGGALLYRYLGKKNPLSPFTLLHLLQAIYLLLFPYICLCTIA